MASATKKRSESEHSIINILSGRTKVAGITRRKKGGGGLGGLFFSARRGGMRFFFLG